jgi:hypothetical protein
VTYYFFVFFIYVQYLGPTQPPIQCAPGALLPGIKQPGRETDQSPPSSAEVKECVELYLHSFICFTALYLVKQDNFTFTSGANRGGVSYRLHASLAQEPGYLGAVALGHWLDDRGFDSRQGLGIFLFTTASRPVLGPTQPPIQWTPGALSVGVKRPGREADHSPPSSVEVKNEWSYTSTPPVCLHGMVLS